jgi:hypothetical protein
VIHGDLSQQFRWLSCEAGYVKTIYKYFKMTDSALENIKYCDIENQLLAMAKFRFIFFQGKFHSMRIDSGI